MRMLVNEMIWPIDDSINFDLRILDGVAGLECFKDFPSFCIFGHRKWSFSIFSWRQTNPTIYWTYLYFAPLKYSSVTFQNLIFYPILSTRKVTSYLISSWACENAIEDDCLINVRFPDKVVFSDMAFTLASVISVETAVKKRTWKKFFFVKIFS